MSPKKANGEWVPNFDPQLSGGIGSRMYFAENNTWVWTFNVMHDIEGLIGLMGGETNFVKRLDRLFNEPTKIAKWQFMGQFPDCLLYTSIKKMKMIYRRILKDLSLIHIW